MSAKSGYKYSALQLQRYATFFQDIESQWESMPDPNGLVQFFGPEHLRRHRLLTSWLDEVHSQTVNPDEFRYAAESRQIENLMTRLCSNSICYQLAEGYLHFLEHRRLQRGTGLRSLRLALTPAIALLKTSEGERPSQRHVNQYLKVKPGQRAALTGFINYLKIQHTYDLKMPASPSLYAQHAKIEKQLLALMTAETPTKNPNREWVRLGLMYFHNVATTHAREVASTVTRSQPINSFEVEIAGHIYWLPACPSRG